MIYVHGIGHFHPENVITNKFLEDLDIGTTEDWIMERVGIETRRTILPLDYIRETKNARPWETDQVRLYSNAQLAGRAAKMAIARAGIKVEDIGMVISGSSLPEYLTPPEAATVACELGIDVPCFDVNAACATYGVQMFNLDLMRPEKLPPYVLVTNIECPTPSTNYADRASAVLFGDAAAATVISTKVPSSKAYTDCEMDSKPTMWEKAKVPRWSYFSQDGNAVQGFAIRKTTDGLRSLRALVPEVSEKHFYFVGHQANLGVLRTACERTGIVENRHWYNVHLFGNTGSAGAASVLSQHWDELGAGDVVALAFVGAGLTWTQMLLRIK
jgi:3-oxoacyl-[acyl-carrier-protein] synthase III